MVLPHPKMTRHPVSGRQLGGCLRCLFLESGDYMAQVSRHTLPMENAISSHLHSSLIDSQGLLRLNGAWKL